MTIKRITSQNTYPIAKMKKPKGMYLLLSVIALLLTGCIRDYQLDCPGRVNLTFSYTGDTNDTSMFAKMIDQVTVLVFNSEGEHILTQIIDKQKLSVFKGTELTLDAGTYSIVCWANAFENTEVTENNRISEKRVHHPNFLKGTSIPTMDHIYYGQHTITVADNDKLTENIPFSGAHINIKVYVDSSIFKNSNEEVPTVEAHNILPQYDMQMGSTQPFQTTYYPHTVKNRENGLYECFFQVLRFEDDNPVKIEIKNKSGLSVYKLDLKTYMAENNISVNEKNEATVPVLFEYTDLGISVSVPKWEGIIVEPEA